MNLIINSILKHAIACGFVIFAFDVEFKYLYGRSIIVDRDSIYMNLGIISIILTLFGLFYLISFLCIKRRFELILISLFALFAVQLGLYFYGREFLRADREFADLLMKSKESISSVNNLSFNSVDVKRDWLSESSDVRVEFSGKSAFHNLFIYNAYGSNSYTVFVYIRPIVEVEIGRHH